MVFNLQQPLTHLQTCLYTTNYMGLYCLKHPTWPISLLGLSIVHYIYLIIMGNQLRIIHITLLVKEKWIQYS